MNVFAAGEDVGLSGTLRPQREFSVGAFRARSSEFVHFLPFLCSRFCFSFLRIKGWSLGSSVGRWLHLTLSVLTLIGFALHSGVNPPSCFLVLPFVLFLALLPIVPCYV